VRDPTLPPSNHVRTVLPAELLLFSTADSLKLTAYLDANDLRNQRSTAGYALLLSSEAVSYRCKTQFIAATSSAEAEFLTVIAAAKHERYLHAIVKQLGFLSSEPTLLHCDNQSAINVINAGVPIERSRHIDIQHFAIQDWKDSGDIVMKFIPGFINPSDDLTKPLGWVLHERHARHIMGHC